MLSEITHKSYRNWAIVRELLSTSCNYIEMKINIVFSMKLVYIYSWMQDYIYKFRSQHLKGKELSKRQENTWYKLLLLSIRGFHLSLGIEGLVGYTVFKIIPF